MKLSKYIKILCYTLIVISCVIGFVLILLGLSRISDEEKSSTWWVFVIAGILVPLISAVNIYPLLALSQIEENLTYLNHQIDDFSDSTNTKLSKIIHKVDMLTQQQRQDCNDLECPTILKHTNQTNSNGEASHILSMEAVNFINQKYNANVSISDDISIIKQKILQIDHNSSSVFILKNKVCSAQTKKEIIDSFILHRMINE